MILFDLKCSSNHVFEVWFKDSKQFYAQQKKGLVSCPVCNDTNVNKALMMPNISKKSNTKKVKKTINKTLINKISKFKKKIEENFDYVGKDFTDEAKKIKYGEAEDRGIYGEANLEQTKELLEEDISFVPLPWSATKKSN